MLTNPINFKQERDFGDLFNATFSFISQEFKRLATAMLYFVLPAFLLSGIAMSLYSVKSQEMLQSTAVSGASDPFAAFTVLGSLFGYLGLVMIVSLVASSMLMSTVYGYIKLFIENGSDGFTLNDVWGQISKNFLSFLVASFILGLVVMLGFVFCILPGIYLGVALSIVLCIMIFEEKGFIDAFGRSIKLINQNWWQTFAVIIISTIILYVLVLVFSIPGMLFGFKSFFTNISKGQPLTTDLPVSYYVVNVITHIITQALLVIPVVTSAFIYYGAVERLERPSLMDKISQINTNE